MRFASSLQKRVNSAVNCTCAKGEKRCQARIKCLAILPMYSATMRRFRRKLPASSNLCRRTVAECSGSGPADKPSGSNWRKNNLRHWPTIFQHDPINLCNHGVKLRNCKERFHVTLHLATCVCSMGWRGALFETWWSMSSAKTAATRVCAPRCTFGGTTSARRSI